MIRYESDSDEADATPPLLTSSTTPTHREIVPRRVAFSLSSCVALVLFAACFWDGFDISFSSQKQPRILESRIAHLWHSLSGAFHSLRPKKRLKSIKRVAIVRPFSVKSVAALSSTFDVWKNFPPCQYNNTWDGSFAVDVFLSFSQTYALSTGASKALEDVKKSFRAGKNSWAQCVGDIFGIDGDIPQKEDIYSPLNAQKDVDWVNGPNRQFESIMDYFLSDSETSHQYDVLYLMEADSIPRRKYWLDALLNEAEINKPFAILGSKYDGDSWDKFRDQLPLSLQHHINGNAVYNLSSPLLKAICGQLKSEATTPYNSVPYDYRISQIIYEGYHGHEPDIPERFKKLRNRRLSKNGDKFKTLLGKYDEVNPMKESKIISNFAATNLLPRHMNNAFIVHGAKYYAEWNPKLHDITLVVSEWHDDLSSKILSDIKTHKHPFKKVTLMVPDDLPPMDLETSTKTPVLVQTRTFPDYMDICKAHVTTEWFMITNAFHGLTSHIDLLFDPEDMRPIAPYTPAEKQHCFIHPGCRALFKSAKKIYDDLDFVVHDSDVLFKTSYRDQFCEYWESRFKQETEDKYKEYLYVHQSTSLSVGPTGASYMAYLLFKNEAEKIYSFTDRTFHGARENFKKVFIAEEMYHEIANPSAQYQRHMQADPPASAPTKITTNTFEQEKFRCKDWCEYIPLGWWSSSGQQKCDWSYSCGHCDQCFT